MAKQPPQIILHPLNNADGSARYTAPNGLHTIVAGANYPVEVPYRSDEIPDSTLIEVNLTPHNGITMVKERHVESLVKQMLKCIVRLEDTPRLMLQVTLQVTAAETDENLPGGIKDGGQGESYLPVLASAINATVLACLDSGVQMKQIAGAVLIGIGSDGKWVSNPGIWERKRCQSLHVFAVTSTGDVVVMESEGPFKVDAWTHALEVARRLVLGEGDTAMLGLLRRAVEENVMARQKVERD